ncbi:hypothetical protein [Kushneria indalinina]|uniref:Uncharacterized protein n=1 Tax=Kushneria indalinina DSM 14324 TaxID=1122140 RepID=A0A3D9DRP4_9GAMM|nr:hypothetical protein [Kushneria indalinina]REC93390.1 hypothetical protein C8D72_3436 [Kushneria indalinina DSM 14324]
MRFEFENVEVTAQALHKSSADFRERYPSESEAVQYMKEKAVELFTRNYSAATGPEVNGSGVLEVPIWRGVGVTFAVAQDSEFADREEWSVETGLLDVQYVEAVFWVALPL